MTTETPIVDARAHDAAWLLDTARKLERENAEWQVNVADWQQAYQKEADKCAALIAALETVRALGMATYTDRPADTRRDLNIAVQTARATLAEVQS